MLFVSLFCITCLKFAYFSSENCFFPYLFNSVSSVPLRSKKQLYYLPMKWLLLVLVVLFLLIQYSLWFGESSLPGSWDIKRQVQAQKVENKLLEQRNKTLTAEVLDLKQGKDAIEERARSELGMIKKDETFYQIIENEKQ